MTRSLTLILAGTLLVLAGGPLSAQNAAGDAASGRRLAQQWCAECHVIAPPLVRGPNQAAPTFGQIADDPAMTPARVRAVLRAPHRSMSATALSESQVDDVIAYIGSVKQ